jgi:hypothetical protein
MAELEFIGTATTVPRIGPFTILTDPNFLHRGERAYLGYRVPGPPSAVERCSRAQPFSKIPEGGGRMPGRDRWRGPCWWHA